MAEQTTDNEAWYTVRVSIPWLVRGIDLEAGDTHQDAINIAISELDKQTADAQTGRRDITVQTFDCTDPDCDHQMEAVMANAGLVMVNLTMAANIEAESADHAEQLAKREIGQCVDDTPLRVVGVAHQE